MDAIEAAAIEAACEAAAATETPTQPWERYMPEEKRQCRALMRAAIAAYLAATGVERDAERYRKIRKKVGADSVMGRFSIPVIHLPSNWRKGSIAEHFDNVIDSARGGEHV